MATGQYQLVNSEEPKPGQYLGKIAFFDAEGNPVDIGGGGDVTVAWASVTGKPSTFPPATHTHTIANVTGLQTALDGKQASGSYATVAALNAAIADLQDQIDAINGGV